MILKMEIGEVGGGSTIAKIAANVAEPSAKKRRFNANFAKIANIYANFAISSLFKLVTQD